MDNRQKTMMEDEMNSIQRKIDEAVRFAEADNYFGNQEQADRWQTIVGEEIARLNGIKIALAVLGFNAGWHKDRYVIIQA